MNFPLLRIQWKHCQEFFTVFEVAASRLNRLEFGLRIQREEERAAKIMKTFFAIQLPDSAFQHKQLEVDPNDINSSYCC